MCPTDTCVPRLQAGGSAFPLRTIRRPPCPAAPDVVRRSTTASWATPKLESRAVWLQIGYAERDAYRRRAAFGRPAGPCRADQAQPDPQGAARRGRLDVR